MTNAQSVAVFCAVLASVFCAISAFGAWLTWKWATKTRSIISMQGELAEIRDYMAKLDRWAKRINARETMAERRSAAPSDEPRKSLRSVSTSNDKDELRRRAGLVAGQPARHEGAS